MSLLLLFAEQEQLELPVRRRRRVTVVLPRRKRTRVVTPLEEWKREPSIEALAKDDLERALREDEEFLLFLV